MRCPVSRVLVGLFLCQAMVGCVPLQFLDPSWKESQTALVPSGPFATSQSFIMPFRKVSLSSAKGEYSVQVAALGERILNTNPEIGMKPYFATAGTQSPEIFHQGQHFVYITDGLVKRCKNEGQLAALLALELAKMVVEREALANPKTRQTKERPPIHVDIGRVGSDAYSDQTDVVEMARYEARQKNRPKRQPLPDPIELARRYLTKADFRPENLDSIQPLLKEAEQSYQLEKQFKGSVGPVWTPSQ